MTTWTIHYLDGTDPEQITADLIEPSNDQYYAYRDNKPIAYFPITNIRSVRQHNETTNT